MKKKLLLINIVDLDINRNKKFSDSFAANKLWQPMPLGIIAALTPDDWDIELIDENFETAQFKEADLVGITSHTCSINRAYNIAQIYKDKNIPVVLGGMHASFFPEEAQKYVQIIAVGKAEGLWPEIINDFNNKSLKNIYYSNDKAEVLYKPDRKLFKKYDYTIATIQASLGCPNNCEFCNIPIFQSNKYYLRDIDSIVDEIKELEQYYFLFGDDNFFGTTEKHRERAKALLNKMIKAKIKKKWWCTTSIDISKHPDILWLAHKAGCVLVFVGMESFNLDELSQLNKNANLKFVANNYKDSIDTLHKNKIAVLGSFICGGDDETIEGIRLKGQAIRNTKLDNIALRFLTPLPKTRLYDKLEKEGRLLYTSYPEDWIYYNLSTVTFKTPNTNPTDLYNAYKNTFGAMLGPHKGLIKDHFVYRFIKTIIYTKSISVAVDANIIFAFLHIQEYNSSKFFKILFKLFRPKIKLNN